MTLDAGGDPINHRVDVDDHERLRGAFLPDARLFDLRQRRQRRDDVHVTVELELRLNHIARRAVGFGQDMRQSRAQGLVCQRGGRLQVQPRLVRLSDEGQLDQVVHAEARPAGAFARGQDAATAPVALLVDRYVSQGFRLGGGEAGVGEVERVRHDGIVPRFKVMGKRFRGLGEVRPSCGPVQGTVRPRPRRCGGQRSARLRRRRGPRSERVSEL